MPTELMVKILKIVTPHIKRVMINNERVITLPYADDLCLITQDLRTQQCLINQINSHIQSMGMLLKPSKCRAFSIQAGKPSIVQFYIGDNLIPPIAQEEQKIHGSYSSLASQNIH